MCSTKVQQPHRRGAAPSTPDRTRHLRERPWPTTLPIVRIESIKVRTGSVRLNLTHSSPSLHLRRVTGLDQASRPLWQLVSLKAVAVKYQHNVFNREISFKS